MLQSITIRNLALIESAEIEMSGGFTAITGETGAGKSILLGALMLLAGARAEKTQIKKNADACEVEAVLYFNNPDKVNNCLNEHGLPPCEENMLILRRVIHREKAGRIYINNASATQTVLQNIGELWIDFHGPGEHQRLFSERYQLEILDLYAKNQKLLAGYQHQFHEWKNLCKEISELSSAGKLSPDDIYFLKSQIEQIDSVELEDEAIEKLECDFKRLSNAQKIIELASSIESKLQADNGVLENLIDATKLSRELADLDSSKSELSKRMHSLVVEVEDLLQEYSNYLRGMEFDENSSEDLNERMNRWLDLKRRYGPNLQSIREKRSAFLYKLNTQADVEGTIEALRKKLTKIETRLKTLDKDLHESRHNSAKVFCKKVSALFKTLGLQQAKLDVAFTQDSGEFLEYGTRKCMYYFQSNTGEDSMPLNKIASSGELARVMLAIKAVLAEADELPVLVFDEVDANVGGEVGVRVGTELASLGKSHQVICVTHLPQVAAQAESHFLITKVQGKDKTDVHITVLHDDKKARLAEISRMLGNRSSTSALHHAKELLGL